MVLGTANRSEPRPGLDFFPLTVDFEERMYAAGKIPGGFIKREARPSEAAILAARLTDRPIRPLFPEGYKDDVQLVITVLSTDQENDPDVLGTIAASAALTISEIPFLGPDRGRPHRPDRRRVRHQPDDTQLADSELDLIVSGTRDAIMMVEAGAKLLPEDVMAEAILFGHRALQPIIDLQEELQKLVGKAKQPPVPRARHRVGPRLRRQGPGQRRVRRGRHRDDRHRPQDGRPRRDRARSGSRAARSPTSWSTLVNPGRSIIGHQIHGITDKDVLGRAVAEGRRRDLPRRSPARRRSSATRRLRPRLHRGGEGRRLPLRARTATSTRSCSPARATRASARATSSRDLAKFFGIELKSSHRAAAGRRGDRRARS